MKIDERNFEDQTSLYFCILVIPSTTVVVVVMTILGMCLLLVSKERGEGIHKNMMRYHLSLS